MLHERLLKNYTEMRAGWMDWPLDMLIDHAHRIAAVKDTYSCLIHEHMTEKELDRLLQFQSPLEVVADKWQERMENASDFSFAFNAAIQDDDTLLCYPLVEKSVQTEKTSVLEKLKGKAVLQTVPQLHTPTKEQEVR